jgi:hypothetical protein
MKKLSVAILSVALSVNSFAGGNDDWVGPLIVGGIAGALIARNFNKSPEVVYVQPGVQPSYIQGNFIGSNPNVVNTNAFPQYRGVNITPPYGFHYQYIYDNYCNCYKQALVPN